MKKVAVFKSVYLFVQAVALLFVLPPAHANNNSVKEDSDAIVGRWDMVLSISGKVYPSWLEVMRSGSHTLVGRYVGIVGSSRPISKINFSGGKMSFAIPPQWEGGNNDAAFEGTMVADSLTGTMVSSDGKNFTWTAHRAPLLERKAAVVWGEPISLFNGKDMTGWHALGTNQWIVANGILSSPHKGANLVTDNTFTDFKLHIEFRYPKGSNSGVYLRGRYEVQIEDSDEAEPAANQFGSVYGFLAPSEPLARTPDKWQSYDIILTGRMVTIMANGKTIICNQEIPGITGGAINSREEEPGPLLIQGDHSLIDYRNIVITPAKYIRK